MRFYSRSSGSCCCLASLWFQCGSLLSGFMVSKWSDGFSPVRFQCGSMCSSRFFSWGSNAVRPLFWVDGLIGLFVPVHCGSIAVSFRFMSVFWGFLFRFLSIFLICCGSISVRVFFFLCINLVCIWFLVAFRFLFNLLLLF